MLLSRLVPRGSARVTSLLLNALPSFVYAATLSVDFLVTGSSPQGILVIFRLPNRTLVFAQERSKLRRGDSHGLLDISYRKSRIKSCKRIPPWSDFKAY